MNKFISYIGSKEKLFDFLYKNIVKDNSNKKLKFVDGFTGTTVVSKLIKDNTNWDITLCDLSNYSYTLRHFLKLNKNSDFDFNRFEKNLKNLNDLFFDKNTENIFFNEFSENGVPKTIKDFSIFDNQPVKSRMFFKEEIGQKIDTIRNGIFKLIKNKKEFSENDDMIASNLEIELYLLFLLRFADRNRNTTSVYGAYLKHFKNKKLYPFYDENLLNIIKEESEKESKSNINVKKGDILENLKSLDNDIDIIYLDPPYNTRSYEGNYHILNYLVDLNFQPLKELKENSKTGMSLIKLPNKFKSKKGTKEIFEDMIVISKSKSKKVFISYNSEGVVTEEEIKNICNKYDFKLLTYKKEYKRFTSGEGDKKNNGKKNQIEEIIWEIY